jgi:HEPN domain-containing protein
MRLVIKLNEKVEYWLDLAHYDFVTAKAMLQTDRYLYVGFMCQQTVEKALKAMIARDCSENEFPPKIHNLTKLAERTEVFNAMDKKQRDFLRELNPLNIEARYPEYKNELLAMLTKDKCVEFITETENLLCWIKTLLSTQSDSTPSPS